MFLPSKLHQGPECLPHCYSYGANSCLQLTDISAAFERGDNGTFLSLPSMALRTPHSPDFLPTCLVAPFQSPQQAPLPLPILSAGVPQSSVLDPFLHPTRPFFLGDLIGYHGFKDQIWIGNSQVAM